MLSRLSRLHRLKAVVTTNVDGLETDSRIPGFLADSKVLRLHGVVYELKCHGHTVPLTVEMANALADKQPVDLSNCAQCSKQEATGNNGRQHLKRSSATPPPAPPMRFFDDSEDIDLGDAEQAMFTDIFKVPHLPPLVFVIGSSLRNRDLKKALLGLVDFASIYIVDPLPNKNHKEFLRATIIRATADEWATRVNASLTEETSAIL